MDTFTCYDLYEELTTAGFTFAPIDIAARFAIEQPTEAGVDLNSRFGYHGKRHVPTDFLLKEQHLWKRRLGSQSAGARVRVAYKRYTVSDSERQAELDKCYEALQTNRAIDELATIEGRPSFQDLFDQMSETVGATATNAVDLGGPPVDIVKGLGQTSWRAYQESQKPPEKRDLPEVYRKGIKQLFGEIVPFVRLATRPKRQDVEGSPLKRLFLRTGYVTG